MSEGRRIPVLNRIFFVYSFLSAEVMVDTGSDGVVYPLHATFSHRGRRRVIFGRSAAPPCGLQADQFVFCHECVLFGRCPRSSVWFPSATRPTVDTQSAG